MEIKNTYYWTRGDFLALEKVRGMAEGWGDFEFAQRSRNDYKIMVPSGWETPTLVAEDARLQTKSNKALKNLLLIAGIFIVLPWIIKKTRQKHIRN